MADKVLIRASSRSEGGVPTVELEWESWGPLGKETNIDTIVTTPDGSRALMRAVGIVSRSTTDLEKMSNDELAAERSACLERAAEIEGLVEKRDRGQAAVRQAWRLG